ncbi:MAG: DUF3301 domain-containing protein [Chromatiales bacterium]|nr:DUF3301 domain-containing protein [Chromatiales bacterium]
MSGIGLWFWRDSLGAREQARAASSRACQQSGVQLLDDTVALERLWWRRDRDGRLKLERLYVFEFYRYWNASAGSAACCWSAGGSEVLHMEGGDLLVP